MVQSPCCSLPDQKRIAPFSLYAIMPLAAHPASFLRAQVGNITLSDQEVEELREVFNLVDRDGGGTISSSEVHQLLIMLGKVGLFIY